MPGNDLEGQWLVSKASGTVVRLCEWRILCQLPTSECLHNCPIEIFL